eukprot:COSAG02_NODE_516_length_20804_cov_162.717460_6_plen_107_part_00
MNSRRVENQIEQREQRGQEEACQHVTVRRYFLAAVEAITKSWHSASLRALHYCQDRHAMANIADTLDGRAQVHFTVINGEGQTAIRGGVVQLSCQGLADVVSRSRL